MSVQVSRRAAALALLTVTATAAAPTGLSLYFPDAVFARGERSTVIGRSVPYGMLGDLARRADRAAVRVGAVLGTPVRPLIVVPASDAGAAALARTGAVDGLAALADRGRVIVVPSTFATLSPTGRDVVLAHELTHVAAGTGRAPLWLREGLADYVAYRDAGLPVPVAAAELAAEVRAGHVPHRLPGPEAFAPGGTRLAQAYQESWLACRMIAAEFGEERLVRLYRDALEGDADLSPFGDFTTRWRAYLREQLEGGAG
ncbi:hypothetical protein ACIBH1_08085 [Nonomuraea sp. NPDC050663]|uniref:hypothetical protein n=1 Tax=Nonomuraea sp. NPDC050663 TaxID=3364370 RepID=UPI0037904CA1